jgi:hypothetical protein
MGSPDGAAASRNSKPVYTGMLEIFSDGFMNELNPRGFTMDAFKTNFEISLRVGLVSGRSPTTVSPPV